MDEYGNEATSEDRVDPYEKRLRDATEKLTAAKYDEEEVGRSSEQAQKEWDEALEEYRLSAYNAGHKRACDRIEEEVRKHLDG